MSDMVVRDYVEMEKCAQKIDEYSADMRRVCAGLKNAVSLSAPLMKDEDARRVLTGIETLATELIRDLPRAEYAAEALRRSAKPLREAVETIRQLRR
ncbi:MAG: hypothetical protein LBR61_09895 [Synergistaceae bacterium]|jgi:hypothetical protein|nr:hypothetical protein [Synergistaceae bacterium]